MGSFGGYFFNLRKNVDWFLLQIYSQSERIILIEKCFKVEAMRLIIVIA